MAKMQPRADIENLPDRLGKAVRHFWRTRSRQEASQGGLSGRRDYGNRTAATGGKQLDGFNALLAELLVETGLPRDSIHLIGRENMTLPGYFRPTKIWDLVVVASGNLLAAIETKSLCGPSFGNNYNNRVEEAVGSSTDVWTAYREGAFRESPEPFVGYFLLLEEHPKSVRAVSVQEKHFPAFAEFRDASYVGRCEQTIRRLVRERCYNAGCFLVADKTHGKKGRYDEPASDLTFERFATIMCGHVKAAYDAVRDK